MGISQTAGTSKNIEYCERRVKLKQGSNIHLNNFSIFRNYTAILAKMERWRDEKDCAVVTVLQMAIHALIQLVPLSSTPSLLLRTDPRLKHNWF